MKILIVGFYDDNFGDMLIRHCFASLLRVVLKNLGLQEKDYELEQMHLKRIDAEQVAGADLICFSGGGLFGLSYLNFFDFLNEILGIAAEREIPVIFSSMGINNMDATPETEQVLRELLQNPAIKSLSVRENQQLFENYAGEHTYPIEKVCDPAVWAKHVYAEEIREILTNREKEHAPVVGINVVRGGLFASNGYDFKLGDQMKYLHELQEALEQAGIDYRYYTNGSFLDNNTLRHYAREYEVPEEKLDYVQSTLDLVREVARFDAVASIRMHTSILCYAMDIPAVNVIWNAKLPLFYENIGYPDRAIPLEDWTGEHVADRLAKLMSEKEYRQNPDYMMLVYKNLYQVLGDVIKSQDASACNAETLPEIYDFTRVAAELDRISVPREEEIRDLRFKLNKGEKAYLGKFRKERELNKQLKTAESEKKKLEKKLQEAAGKQEKQKEKIEKQKETIDAQKEKIKNREMELETQKKELEKLQARLDRINSHWAVKLYRKVKGKK